MFPSYKIPKYKIPYGYKIPNLFYWELNIRMLSKSYQLQVLPCSNISVATKTTSQLTAVNKMLINYEPWLTYPNLTYPNLTQPNLT